MAPSARYAAGVGCSAPPRSWGLTTIGTPPQEVASARKHLAPRSPCAAAVSALSRRGLHASLVVAEPDLYDAGVVLSTNFGGMISGEAVLAGRAGRGEVAARDFAEYGFQRCADHVAGMWGWRGPRMVLSLSCSSGTAAIGVAADLFGQGEFTADGEPLVRPD